MSGMLGTAQHGNTVVEILENDELQYWLFWPVEQYGRRPMAPTHRSDSHVPAELGRRVRSDWVLWSDPDLRREELRKKMSTMS